MSKKKSKTLTMADSLCNDCKHRFTQIYIPTRPEEFINGNGDPLLEEFNVKTDRLGINICLLADTEIGTDIIIECSHHLSLSEAQEISIFKYLRD